MSTKLIQICIGRLDISTDCGGVGRSSLTNEVRGLCDLAQRVKTKKALQECKELSFWSLSLTISLGLIHGHVKKDFHALSGF